MPLSDRWWYCKACFAIQDGLKDGSSCWNCGRIHRMSKHFPWVEMGTKRCGVCRESYVTWTLPAGTTLNVPDVLGLCRRYFEHYGDNAYFPPMLPLEFILEGNGWVADEKNPSIPKKVRAKRGA